MACVVCAHVEVALNGHEFITFPAQRRSESYADMMIWECIPIWNVDSTSTAGMEPRPTQSTLGATHGVPTPFYIRPSVSTSIPECLPSFHVCNIVQLWIAPLKMYGELECDMAPYRIALYMFTHVLQVNMCFLHVQMRHIHILHIMSDLAVE